jgi:hypothetical protein
MFEKNIETLLLKLVVCEKIFGLKRDEVTGD